MTIACLLNFLPYGKRTGWFPRLARFPSLVGNGWMCYYFHGSVCGYVGVCMYMNDIWCNGAFQLSFDQGIDMCLGFIDDWAIKYAKSSSYKGLESSNQWKHTLQPKDPNWDKCEHIFSLKLHSLAYWMIVEGHKHNLFHTKICISFSWPIFRISSNNTITQTNLQKTVCCSLKTSCLESQHSPWIHNEKLTAWGSLCHHLEKTQLISGKKIYAPKPLPEWLFG